MLASQCRYVGAETAQLAGNDPSRRIIIIILYAAVLVPSFV